METADSSRGSRIESSFEDQSKLMTESFFSQVGNTSRAELASNDSLSNKEQHDTKPDNVAVQSLPSVELKDIGSKTEKSASAEHSEKKEPPKKQPEKAPKSKGKGRGFERCTLIDFGVPHANGGIDTCGGGP